MTAHMHSTLIPGCYRCELNLDEVRAAQQDEAEQAAREAACPGHEWLEQPPLAGRWQLCRLCEAQEDL